MNLDLGQLVSRSFAICWSRKWLWLLGVFGGGQGFLLGGLIRPAIYALPGRRAGNFATVRVVPVTISTQDFWARYGGLIVGAAIALVVIWLISTAIYCIAAPGVIWSAVTDDAGQAVGLRDAWRQGRARFTLFLGLYAIRLLLTAILLALLALVMLGVIAIVGVHNAGAIVTIVLVGVAALLVYFICSILLSLVFVWSERVLVLLNLGVVDAIRASWWLARKNLGDTIVFAIVFGAIVFGISLAYGVIAAIFSVPGIIVISLAWASQSTALLALGVVMILLLAGGASVVAGGFVGSFIQVGYALACRDLCLRHGLKLAVGGPPVQSPAAPAPA